MNKKKKTTDLAGQSPLVSVIMAACRVNPDYLSEAIESILNQTYTNIELVLLYQYTEGDGIKPYLDACQDKRLRVVYTQVEPWSFPTVLNIGLKEAQGKYVARMDADDISLPRRLEKQVSYMENHEEAVVLGGRFRFFHGKGHDTGHLLTPEERAILMLFSNEGIAHPTAMFRREFFEHNHIMYREDKWGAEDYFLWYDVSNAGGEIHGLKSTILKYRQHEGQITRTMTDKIQGLIREVRTLQVSRYADLTPEELDAFLSWDIAKRYDTSFELIEAVFDKIRKGNKTKHLYNPKLMDKILVYKWRTYALSNVKRWRNLNLCRGKYFKGMFHQHNWLYAIIWGGTKAYCIIMGDEALLKKKYNDLVENDGMCQTLITVKSVMGEKKACDFFAQNSVHIENAGRGNKNKIATYFFQMGQGGTEKALILLLGIWNRMGYETYLLLDKANEYSRVVPKETTQVELGDNLKEKLNNLDLFIHKEMPQYIVFHNWMDENLLWELQLCRYNGVKTVVYTHGVFTSNYLYPNPVREYIHRVYRMADMVLAATNLSVDFYRALGCAARLATNPIEPFSILEHIPQEKPTIIWVGRLSVEKQPLEVLKIFREVRGKIDAQLLILGDGDIQIRDEMEKYIHANKLDNDVKMLGYVSNPYELYALSDIYVSTSYIEGFQYSLLESQAYGIPAVMYELPYLPLVEGNDSCIQVKQGDYVAAANQIIGLLLDGEKKEALRKVAKNRAQTMLQKDRSEEWKRIFSLLEEDEHEPMEYTYVDLLLEHMEKYTAEECERMIAGIKLTRTYKIGAIITAPMKKTKKVLEHLKQAYRIIGK